MHTPGHNPYITEQLEPYTFDFRLSDDPAVHAIQLQLQDLYGYQGVNSEIMSVLNNVFGGQFGNSLSVLPGAWSGGVSHGWNQDTRTGLPMTEEHLLKIMNNPDFTVDDGQLQMDYDTLPANIYNWAVQNTSDEMVHELESQEGSVALEGLDFEGQPLGVNIFESESRANVLSERGYLGDKPIKAGEIQALTPEMIEKTESQYYAPYEEAERETLVEKRGQNISGAQTGNFAGSSGRQAGLSAADRMYSSGYGDILSQIMKMQGSATGDVMDTIYGWQELLTEQ